MAGQRSDSPGRRDHRSAEDAAAARRTDGGPLAGHDALRPRRARQRDHRRSPRPGGAASTTLGGAEPASPIPRRRGRSRAAGPRRARQRDADVGGLAGAPPLQGCSSGEPGHRPGAERGRDVGNAGWTRPSRPVTGVDERAPPGAPSGLAGPRVCRNRSLLRTLIGRAGRDPA